VPIIFEKLKIKENKGNKVKGYKGISNFKYQISKCLKEAPSEQISNKPILKRA